MKIITSAIEINGKNQRIKRLKQNGNIKSLKITLQLKKSLERC